VSPEFGPIVVAIRLRPAVSPWERQERTHSIAELGNSNARLVCPPTRRWRSFMMKWISSAPPRLTC